MIDNIGSMGLDLTKSLHGHVRIETRDRWTGRVIDSQEKDNLVTNALAKIYRASRGATDSLWNWFSPIYSKALGGLLLFDTALTESASNYMFPGSAKLVGFAGQGANASIPMAGSYNGSESVLGANSFTSVWDFATSQANGTISSIARTSYQFQDRAAGGSNEFNTSSFGPWAIGAPLAVLGYDSTNKYIYLAVHSTQTYNGTTYETNKIYRAYCDFEAQSLLDLYYIPNPDKWTEIVTVSSATDGTNNARLFVYDPHSNNFYYGANGSTKKIYLIAMDGTRSTITLPVNLSSSLSLAATENYYWYIPASENKIYIVPKANPANTSSASLSFAPSRLIGLGDCVMVGGVYTGSNIAIVYSDASAVEFNTFSNIGVDNVLSGQYTSSNARVPMLLDVYMAFCSSFSSSGSGTARANACYLGTIANLDNPVTKTSSQTMKITYTLTEA